MGSEVGTTERHYKILRKQLDDLGYRQPLAIESLPLVERLISDLLHTTESLRHYKELAQQSLQEHCNLENGSQPYKEENAKLVRECNELHLANLKQKEEAETVQKELKFRIRKLESENSDLQFLSSQHLAHLKNIEKESTEKSRKIIELQSKTLQTTITTSGGKKKSLPVRHPTLEIDSTLKAGKPWKERYWSVCAQVKDPYIANMMEVCDQRICSLTREVNQLKEDRIQQSEVISTMKCQLLNRQREIERLSAMLEGGRPISAISKDCCYKDMEKQITKLTEEVKKMETVNKDLDMKLQESIALQHEAMTRALQLAERNKKLQNEMRDIDRMALVVEAECSTTVKENTKKVSKIQDKLEASLTQIHDLEREILELKRSNQELQADLEASRYEKQNLQKVLENALEEKKKLTDRINKFTVIEHDLMVEIDRLSQSNSQLKRRLAELESKYFHADTIDGSPKHTTSRKASPSRRSTHRTTKNKDISSLSSRSMSFSGDNKSPHDIHQGHSNRQTEEKENEVLTQIRTERDYYSTAYHKLKEQLNNIPDPANNNVELRCKLNEKEQELIGLQQLNRDISREKYNLQARLDSLRCRETRDCTTSPMLDITGCTVKIATETQVAEHARLEKTIMESEDRVRKLEAERRELLSSQGSRKAVISNLEEQIITLRDQLHTAQSELSQQRSLYNQIKSLQEQTDRALADSQGQLTQVEIQSGTAQERIRELERDRAALDREVASVKNERTILRGNLAQLDQEKDGLLLNLDNKTERVALLEQELKSKENRILNLEDSLTELKKKFDITLDENGSREQAIRAAEREADSLRIELDTVERARDNTLRENRRLQDDLASTTQDCRSANRDLDLARGEVDNLKHQVQEYVAEIRRIEELLAQKECERSEMLEQFRGLSMEATVLETNNHSLESETHEQKTQLRLVQDRIIDLEQQLDMRDTLVRSYENQIADLTSHIACLETQMQQHVDQKRKTEADLTAVRDLCVKLDTHKDSLMQQVTDNDVVKIHLERELSRLREEQDLMQDHLTKDRAAINSLEALLATSRQETVEQKLINQEMQSEIQRLRQKVDDLQSRLDMESSESRRYQAQASEYSQQVSDLQRQITNERFERARVSEESRSYSTTL